jgi:hypothetical protein
VLEKGFGWRLKSLRALWILATWKASPPGSIVLELFVQQAALWSGSLDASDPAWRDVAHTIKGAARGIGAGDLGDICGRAEADGAQDLPAVRAALATAVADVRAYLARQD